MIDDTTSDTITQSLVGFKQEKNMEDKIQELKIENFHLKHLIAEKGSPETKALFEKIDELLTENELLKSKNSNTGMKLLGENKSLEHSSEIQDLKKQIEQLRKENQESCLVIETLRNRNNKNDIGVYDLALSDFLALFSHKLELIKNSAVEHEIERDTVNVLQECYREFMESQHFDSLREREDLLAQKLAQLEELKTVRNENCGRIIHNLRIEEVEPIAFNDIDQKNSVQKSLQYLNQVLPTMELVISTVNLVLALSRNSDPVKFSLPVDTRFGRLKQKIAIAENEKHEWLEKLQKVVQRHHFGTSETDGAKLTVLQARIQNLETDNRGYASIIQKVESICSYIVKVYPEIGQTDLVSVLTSFVKCSESKTQKMADLTSEMATVQQKLKVMENQRAEIEKLKQASLSYMERLETENCGLIDQVNNAGNLTSKIQALERQNTALTAQNDLLAQNDEEMIKHENRKLARIVESRNQEIDDLHCKLSTVNRDIEKCKHELRVVQHQSAQLSAEIQCLQVEKHNNTIRIAELVHKNELLSDQNLTSTRNRDAAPIDPGIIPAIPSEVYGQLSKLQQQKTELENRIRQFEDENAQLKNGLYKYDRNNELAVQNQNLRTELQDMRRRISHQFKHNEQRVKNQNGVQNPEHESRSPKNTQMGYIPEPEPNNHSEFYNNLKKHGSELLQKDPQEFLRIYRDLIGYLEKLQLEIVDYKNKINSYTDQQKQFIERFKDLESKYMLICDEKENLLHHKHLAESRLAEVSKSLESAEKVRKNETQTLEERLRSAKAHYESQIEALKLKNDTGPLEERLKSVKTYYESQIEALKLKNDKYVQQLRIGGTKYEENVQESKKLSAQLAQLKQNYDDVCDDLKLCREEVGVLCEKYRDLVQKNSRLLKTCQEYELSLKNYQKDSDGAVKHDRGLGQKAQNSQSDEIRLNGLPKTSYLAKSWELGRNLHSLFDNDVFVAICKNFNNNELLIVLEKLTAPWKTGDVAIQIFERNLKAILEIFEQIQPFLIYVSEIRGSIFTKNLGLYVDDDTPRADLKNLLSLIKSDHFLLQKKYSEVLEARRMSDQEISQFNGVSTLKPNEHIGNDIPHQTTAIIQNHEDILEKVEKENADAIKTILSRLQTCVFVIKSFNVTVQNLKKLAYKQCGYIITKIDGYSGAFQQIQHLTNQLGLSNEMVLEIQQICNIHITDAKTSPFTRHWEKIQTIYGKTAGNIYDSLGVPLNPVNKYTQNRKVTFMNHQNDYPQTLKTSTETTTKLDYSLIKSISTNIELQEILIKALLSPQSIMFLSTISINSFCINKIIDNFQTVYSNHVQKIQQAEEDLKKLKSSENMQKSKRMSEMITSFAQEFSVAKNELIFCQEYLQKKADDIKKYKKQLKTAERQLNAALANNKSQKKQKNVVSERITK